VGRPRAVELDDAVLAAVACFREHGYDSTSVRDLEAATGLKATSLYNAFGSKAGLFNAALDRYHRDVVERRVNEHLRPALGLAGIRSFLVSTYTVEPLPTHGCLVASSAAEFADLDPRARERVEHSLHLTRDALARSLEASRQAGEIDPVIDLAAAADALLIFYEGMLTMLRTGPVTVDPTRAIDATLALLQPRKRNR
jgi:AcrR family transcriptional regulator